MKRANLNFGLSVFSILFYGLLLLATIDFDFSIFTAMMIWFVFESARYIYYRAIGKTDEELNPDEYKTDTMELENGKIVFGGKSKYKPVLLEHIDEVSYLQTEDDYQQVTFTFKGKGSYVYSLNNTSDYMQKKLDKINKSLECAHEDT